MRIRDFVGSLTLLPLLTAGSPVYAVAVMTESTGKKIGQPFATTFTPIENETDPNKYFLDSTGADVHWAGLGSGL